MSFFALPLVRASLGQGVSVPDILLSSNPNLILYYTMDNITGSTIYDESTSANHGTLTGTGTTTGLDGNALSFPNNPVGGAPATDYITLGTQINVAPLTVNVWTFSDGTKTGAMVMGTSLSGNHFLNANSGQFSARNSVGASAVSFNNDTYGWHMWTFVQNGVNVTFYLDGVLKDTVVLPDAGNIILDYVGSYFPTANSAGHSRWDFESLRVFNKAVSAQEVADLYSEFTVSEYPVGPSSLTVTQLTDSSTGNATGVAINGTTALWYREFTTPRSYNFITDTYTDATGGLTAATCSAITSWGPQFYIHDSDWDYMRSVDNGVTFVDDSGPNEDIALVVNHFDTGGGKICCFIQRGGSNAIRTTSLGSVDTWIDEKAEAGVSYVPALSSDGKAVFVYENDSIYVGDTFGTATLKTSLSANNCSGTNTVCREGDFVAIGTTDSGVAKGCILYSTNAGATWNKYIASTAPSIYVYIDKHNGNIVWIENNKSIYVSTDNMATQNFKTSIAANIWNKNAFAVYRNNAVFGTVDSRVYLIETVTGAVTYTGTFNFSAQTTAGAGVFIGNSGSSFYVLDQTADSIYQYSMSTPYKINTGSYDSKSFSVTTQEANPNAFYIRDNGTDMFVTGTSGSVYKYTLSTPWDISTASYASVAYNYTAQAGQGAGLWFKPDGTKMYVSGTSEDRVYEYNLSTPWDITTSSHVGTSPIFTGSPILNANITMDNTGTVLYLMNNNLNVVLEKYTLSTPWDITTLAYNSVEQDVSDTDWRGVFMSLDGVHLYAVERSGTVHQYS